MKTFEPDVRGSSTWAIIAAVLVVVLGAFAIWHFVARRNVQEAVPIQQQAPLTTYHSTAPVYSAPSTHPATVYPPGVGTPPDYPQNGS